VDLLINQSSATIGETISGCFYIRGGRSSRKIKRLECCLVKEFADGSSEKVEDVTTILMSGVIKNKEIIEFPFTFRITEKYEPTSSDFTYKFHTNLVFAENMSSKDHDEIYLYKN
jgi:sporulation-control protein spo0M